VAAPSLLDALRPKPFRGDVIAAGVVVLTTLVWVVTMRFAQAWAEGVHLAYAAGGLTFVTALALLAPMEGVEPRAYQSVLYVASVAVFVDVVVWVARIAGGDGTLDDAGADRTLRALGADPQDVRAALEALLRRSRGASEVGSGLR